jgi:FKBP-type peptidyl-prolyl cis-trans isomerase FkpA
MRVSPNRRCLEMPMTRRVRRPLLVAVLVVTVGTLGACATGRNPAAPAAAPSAGSAPSGTTPPAGSPAAGASRASDQLVAAPQSLPLPGPAAPTTRADGLQIIDQQIGTGKEAQAGKAALVQYTGWLYDDKAPEHKGKQFDSSSASRSGLPFGFIVGVGKVIKGWDQGVAGMKVGGKRTLIVPAPLAYGDKDIGNGLIPPNSTLVFDIELVDVKP